MNQPLALVPIGTDPKSTLPPALSRADDLTRAMLTNGREVSTEARDQLQAHLAKLTRWLGGSSAVEVIPHVAVLRSAMAKAGGSAGQEQDVLMTYAMVLSELPLWAITRACKDYLTGKVGDGRFAPTPAEIAQRCRVLMSRYVEDRCKIERALGIAQTSKDPFDEDHLR